MITEIFAQIGAISLGIWFFLFAAYWQSERAIELEIDTHSSLVLLLCVLLWVIVYNGIK